MIRIVTVVSIFIGVGVLSSCSLFQSSGQTCPAYSSNEKEESLDQEKVIVIETEGIVIPKS